MSLNKSLIEKLKPIKEELTDQIKENQRMKYDPDEASFQYEEGILLTENQAKQILELMEIEGL
jgi:hypothetical protein